MATPALIALLSTIETLGLRMIRHGGSLQRFQA